MEKFESLLDLIQVRLRIILARNADYMLSWDIGNLKNTGDDLIRLAQETHEKLTEMGHRVLHHSIRDAGLGIRVRVLEVQKRHLEEDDKRYFRDVHNVLENICEKIETGEYYQALLKVRDSQDPSKKYFV